MSREKEPLTRRAHATLKDVAERAGVSKMTASRALNTPHLVRKSTRDLVREAIDELNYRPNIAARNLAMGNALFIGLTYNNPSSSYLNELMIGALKASRKAGHQLVVDELSDRELKDPMALAKRMRDGGLDGVIIAPPLSESDDLADALADMKVPFVRLTPGRLGENHAPSIAINDEGAAETMTDRLIELGHKNIGFILGPDGDIQSGARLKGYKTALKKAGLKYSTKLTVRGAYNFGSGMSAAEELLSVTPRPTAIFAANDEMASGAVAMCTKLGLKVPEDISIAGFDDTATATSMWPPLATMCQPIAEMAAKAVEMIDAQVKRREYDAAVVMDVELIERASIAPIKR